MSVSAPLAQLVETERQREAVRRSCHERETARHRGVSYSGMSPEPFQGRTEAEIEADARAVQDDLAAWSATAQGRFKTALALMQNSVQQAASCDSRGLSRMEAARAALHLAEAAGALAEANAALTELAAPYVEGAA